MTRKQIAADRQTPEAGALLVLERHIIDPGTTATHARSSNFGYEQLLFDVCVSPCKTYQKIAALSCPIRRRVPTDSARPR